MRRLLSLIAILLGSGTLLLHAQTTIAQQDFETAPAAPVWTITAGSGDISNATGFGDTPANQRIRNGSRSWQVRNNNSTLNLATVSTLGYTNIVAIVRLSSTSTVSNNGTDQNDVVEVSANLNGAGFPSTPDITVTGAASNNARWSYNNAQNAVTTAGTPITVAGSSGTNQGTIYSTLVVNIPNGTSSVALRVMADNSSTQEVWNVDDVTLTGTQTPTLLSTAPAGFGTQCVGSNTGPNTFAITGHFLTTANITVGPLAGYRFSTTVGGIYGSSLSLSHGPGSYSQTVYVRFQPTVAGSYNGNIPVAGGGATTIQVPVTGTAINGAPAITGTTSNSPICSGQTLNLSVTATGSNLSYAWSGAGTITNGSTANATVAGASTGNYTITVTNACGSANTTVPVVIHVLPTASIGALSTDCIAGTFTVPVTVTGLGSGTAVNIVASPGGVLHTGVSTGTYACTLANGTPVSLSVVSNTGTACSTPLGTFNNAPCLSNGGTCLGAAAAPDIVDNSCASSNFLDVGIGFSGLPTQLGNAPGQTFLESVELVVSHTWRGDLNIVLISPSGQQRNLFLRRPTTNASGNNLGNTTTCVPLVLIDGGAALSTLNAGTTNAAVGNYAPEQTLAGMTGDPNGTWLIRFCDAANNDVGDVRYVKINLKPVDCLSVPGGTTLPGTACNDGNACTINDVYQPNCTCAGTFQDTDGDLTCDANDGCPTDPDKIAPGACGCGVADTDTDGDGAADCIDGCPTDATKITAGICGCETPDDDTDADGIVDCIDPCPNSANNSDTDVDGTPDCLDLCPNDPAKIYPGTCGCGTPDIDVDGDTHADCVDGCPNDPLKIAPGLCGCGVPEVDTDGDTYFDCVDACPNDPLKIGPGTCGCGLADADTDNDGTLDCNDGCPTDGSKTAPGICGCGTADTDTDGDGLADCVDSCPMLAGGIGDACDDGNANTLGDVISTSCACAGNTVITCTLNEVHLFIRTDGQAAQTSWVIETLNGGTPMCSGGNYANNTDITVPCCMPDGSYVLRVMDSFGDGMGNGAGYVLRMADGRRIIDNEHGSSFTVMSSVAQGFTLPLSAERLTSLYCDREDLMPSDFIRAVPSPGVSGQFGLTNSTSGYGFWLFDPDGGYSRRINITHATNNWWFPSGPERATFLKLSSITTNPVPTDQYLNVRVRTMVNGVTSAYGPACRFRIDLLGNCPTTGLVNDVNDPMHSCGISGVVIDGSRTLHVTPVSSATKYQWEFTSGIYIRRITSAGSGLNLAPWATNPLEYGKTYGVRVRVSFDNGVTYCPYGPVCTISTAGSPSADAGRNADQEDRSAALAMWPNPNSDGVLHLTIDDLGMHLETAELTIYDMTGRRVHNERIAVNGESLNSVSELPGTFGPGVYLVNITAGERSYVKRLVIR